MLLDTLVTCLYTERDPCFKFTCLYTGRDPCIRFACLYTCKEACIRFTYRQRPLFKRDFCLRFTCLYTCRDPSQHQYTHSCNHIHQSKCCLGCRSLLCTHIHLYQKINTSHVVFYQAENKRTYCSWILLVIFLFLAICQISILILKWKSHSYMQMFIFFSVESTSVTFITE